MINMVRMSALSLVLILGGCSLAASPADLQLLASVEAGDSTGVDAALAAGARPNFTSSGSLPPLFIAVMRNDRDSVRKLLAAGANPNVVHSARSLEGLVRARASTADMKAGITDPALAEGMSLISLAADGEMVEILVNGGADPNIRDAFGATPLCIAAKDGDVELIRALRRLGADVNAVDVGGNTPLSHALRGGRVNVIAELLAAGADPRLTDWRGRDALHQAAMIPSGAAIPPLLEAGVDINRPDSEGNTALIFAARDGYDRAVAVLLEGGANPKLTDRTGHTAMDWAVAGGHVRVVALLESSGEPQPNAEPSLAEMKSQRDAAAGRSMLEVFTSSVVTDGRHLKIRGKVSNPTAETVRGVRYRVAILSPDRSRILDTFNEERDDTVIEAADSIALRLDVATTYASGPASFVVEAFPMRLGDRELPEPPPLR